ncbi:hypothetical protein CJ239_00040 [Streptococcus sp. UMB0029]|nr:hypothetical protein CJ239_00040 [Streptococcus sp. UMB0029]
MAFQPRFGIQPCLSVGIFYSGLYLLENIILFSKLHYYITFLRTCKVFFDKKQKYVRKLFSLCKNIDKYFLINDYNVNEMMIVFNLKFFHAILYSFHSVFDRLDKMTTFLHY